MSEMYEAAIAIYLTRGGAVFIAPQYIIDWNKERQEGGTVPDFVAIDYSAKEIVVVEVTAGAPWKPLLAKVRQRQGHWYQPIARQLLALDAINQAWQIRFLGFIREQGLAEAKVAFEAYADVTVAPLERCVHSWHYWAERKDSGLPGKGRSTTLPIFSTATL